MPKKEVLKPNVSKNYAKQFAFSSVKNLRNIFKYKPIRFVREIEPDYKFPPKIRKIFAHIWLQVDEKGEPCSRFIIKGPRGGGKSKLLGAIGFVKWFLQGVDIVDMGGSLEQAKGVYNYFSSHCFSHPLITESLPKEPLMQYTQSDLGNYFKAVAASTKAIRGPHPDVLFGDEVCETKDELILAALPIVNTSDRQLIVLTSTFHKIFGMFQETWDQADKLGYMRFTWDMFDVTKPFNASVWQDKRLQLEIPDLTIKQAGEQSLEYRAGGRTGEEEGWVPIGNIIQAWREKSTLDWFDVEYMGTRPNASGMVLDPIDVERATFERSKRPELKWKKGSNTVLGIDWGFSSMTSVIELMEYIDAQKVELWNKNYTQVRSKVIIDDVIERVIEHKITRIYADSAGKFENAELRNRLIEELPRDHKCVVIEVVFSKEKETMLGNYRAHFQRGKYLIPSDHKEAIYQHKRYRYIEGSDKVVKKEDHIPDATQCALQHFPLKKVSKGIDKSNVDRSTHSDRQESIASSLLHERF